MPTTGTTVPNTKETEEKANQVLADRKEFLKARLLKEREKIAAYEAEKSKRTEKMKKKHDSRRKEAEERIA